jgi:MSHA biogenesis protein MshI
MKIPFISSLLKSKKHDTGQMAVILDEYGVYLSKIELIDGGPCVVRCEYHQMDKVSAASMGKLCREAHLGRYKCTTLLAPSEYQMLMVDAPAVPVNELKTAVRWKIKDSLNYHVEDATIDVLPIPGNESGSERAKFIYVIAASNVTIEKCIALFDQAKIELTAIDIPELAQRNVAALFEQDEQALAMLAFNDDGGLITFTAGGELYLSRLIEVSASQLQDADENLRKQYRERVEFELQRSLDYFDSQFGYMTVDRVLVCVPDNTGLVEFLATVVDTKVEKLDLSRVMDISVVSALADSGFASRALPSLGAALRPKGHAS